MRLLIAAGLGAFATGCGGFDSAKGEADTGWAATTAASETINAGADDGAFTYTGEPEDETDRLALMPAQTDAYVFVANPDRDTVTRIDVRTHDVLTTSVGADPRLVLTTRDYRTAVVLNRADDTVTLVDAATMDTTTVPIRDNLNAMTLSPDGSWAALWHDPDRVRPDDPAGGGATSFSEASFVDLRDGTHHGVLVGFAPRNIVFTDDSAQAIVVQDEALSTLDLTTGEALRPESIDIADPLDPPPAEEIVLDPTGTWAIVRQFGVAELLLVDLIGRSVESLAVGDNPTDLDVAPDGLTAVAVARGDQQLWRYDLSDPTADPIVLDMPEGAELGSVEFDPTGTWGFLYTTASRSAVFATWDLGTDEMQLRSLAKPIETLAVSPTGESLMIFHTDDDDPDLPTDPTFDNNYALTVLDIRTWASNLVLLPGAPIGYMNSTNGSRGYFILEDVDALHVVDYPSLLTDVYELGSPPVFVGVLPDLDPTDGDEPPAWVSQSHDLGRISFFDADGSTLETITGFELNGAIEQ